MTKTQRTKDGYLEVSVCEGEEGRFIALNCCGCKRFIAMSVVEDELEWPAIVVCLRHNLNDWCDEATKYCLPIKPDEDS